MTLSPKLPQPHSLEEIDAELCLRPGGFFYFVQQFWDVICREKPVWNWHIEFICQELEIVGYRIKNREASPYDLIINVPPGTTKSILCSQMWPVWLWVIDQTIRILSGSHSMSLATRDAVASRDIIRSEKFKRMFPHIEIKSDNDNKTEYQNTDTGLRVATSPGTTAIGKHFHVFIPDDPVNPMGESAEEYRMPSMADINQANAWVDYSATTRVIGAEQAVTVMVMQRLHEEDPSGYWLKKKDRVIRHICLPAELSDEVKPVECKDRYVDGLLDPVRLSQPILAKKKLNLGSFGYAGQYSQLPAPKEGGLIKRHWFKIISRYDFSKIKATGLTNHYMLDTAYTEKQKNDPTVIMCMSVYDNHLYVSNLARVWKEFPDLIKFIPQFVEENGNDAQSKIVIEPKASGKSVKQQISNNTLYNVIESKPPDVDKLVRASGATPFIESGRVILVDGPWVEEFLSELTLFPNARHDDQVDVLVMGVDMCKKLMNNRGIY